MNMNSGFSIFKLCASAVFIVICFLLVMERTNLNKTAEITGMEGVIEQTKRDLSSVSNSLKFFERKFDTPIGKIYKRTHSEYTLYISCLHKGPLYGFMLLGKDQGNLPRKDKFTFDTSLPKECRQSSTSSYNSTYHRGHLFAANHFDNSELGMYESFFMSNVVPQHSVSNLGAWKATEVITECYREHHQIYLAAGVIYGTETDDDLFLKTHGVVTPAAMWKLIVLDNNSYSAWIIPNTSDSKTESLESYEVSLEDLIRIININITKNPSKLVRVKLPIFKKCHIS